MIAKFVIYIVICTFIDIKLNLKENEELNGKTHADNRKLHIKSAADIFHEPTSHIVKELVSRV